MNRHLLLLIAAVLLSVASAFAQGGTTGPLTWEINDGTLTISGKGDMPDYLRYPDYEYSPWYEYRENITTVVIMPGVTRIGSCAFMLCESLVLITIPNGVTTIGDQAFRFCTLTSITIPSSVTTIEHWAFYVCDSLTSITNLNPIPVEIDEALTFLGAFEANLVVPTSAVLAYQNAEVWELFNNIVGGGLLVNPVSSNSEYGYTIGNGLYEGGGKSTATLTAVAFSGYKFVNWTIDGLEISTDNPYSFTVTEDVELVANFEEEVGIENIEATTIKIYPNPTTGELKIEGGELRIKEIVIFDIYGRKQKSEREVLIDISDFPVGVYFLWIRTDKGEVIKKVLKE